MACRAAERHRAGHRAVCTPAGPFERVIFSAVAVAWPALVLLVVTPLGSAASRLAGVTMGMLLFVFCPAIDAWHVAHSRSAALRQPRLQGNVLPPLRQPLVRAGRVRRRRAVRPEAVRRRSAPHARRAGVQGRRRVDEPDAAERRPGDRDAACPARCGGAWSSCGAPMAAPSSRIAWWACRATAWRCATSCCW